MPTGAIRSPIRNGRRQPQEARSSGDITFVRRAPRDAPSNAAAPWLTDCQLTTRPRLDTGTVSITYVEATPISPPTAKPCSARPMMMMTGAAAPIIANGGQRAMAAVPTVIRPMVLVIAARRPTRSA